MGFVNALYKRPSDAAFLKRFSTSITFGVQQTPRDLGKVNGAVKLFRYSLYSSDKILVLFV